MTHYMPLAICVVPAVFVTLLSFAVLRSARTVTHGLRGSLPRPVPAPLRAMLLPARFLGRLCAPLLPGARRQRLQTQLCRAELDDLLQPTDWLGMRLLCAACVLTLMLGLRIATFPWALFMACLAFALAGQWLRNRVTRNARSILRELPAYMDMLTLAVEGGCTLLVAMRLAIEKATASPLRRAFESVLREVRGGRARSEALDLVCRRLNLPGLTEVSTALAQAELSGMSLGGILRAQAEQRGNERFARAEKLAMEAPVKMLGPLILCIFPCTFIVIGFPIAVRLMGQVP